MTSARLDKLAGLIEWPDDDARTEAVSVLRNRRAGSLGRLGDAAAWWAAVTGQCPPSAPHRVKLLLFTDDGALPEIVARVASSGLHVVQSTRADGGENAAWDALAKGALLAEAEADAGTDLLLLAAPSDAARIPAATLIAFVNGTDAQTVASTLRGDQEWIRMVTGVRNSLRRVKKAEEDPLALLEALGGTEIPHLTGVILGAAARRTPMIFEGMTCTAAAVMAHRIAGAAGSWFMPAHADPDPAGTAGLRHMGRSALLDLGLWPGDGIAVLLASEMLKAAAAAISSSASDGETWFSDPLSALSDPPADAPPEDPQPS